MTATRAMRIVAARDLVPRAPAGLEALVICERPPAGAVRRLCAVGDVGAAGHLTPRRCPDPFREVAPVLRDADLTFANLETPLIEGETGEPFFAAPVSAAPRFAAAGFRLLNLANNHILDFGVRGLSSTRRALAEAGLEVLGVGADAAAARRPVVADLGGLRLGWLGCARTLQPQNPGDEGLWEYDPGALCSAVREARAGVDLLAVSIHMGYMYVDYPHPRQRREALAFAEAGADLVLMHHAHVLQGIEIAPGGGVICYNLGNFHFDWTLGQIVVENRIEEQRSGGLFVFELDRRGVCRGALLPVRVDDDWIVRWAPGERGRAILEHVQRISGGWGRDAAGAFHRQLAERATGLAVREALRRLRYGGLREIPEIARRLRGHHFRMVAGWPIQRLKRWLRARASAR